VIDITLSSSDIKREIYNWRVTTDVSLSVHRIIRFKIISDPRKPYEYRNPRSTDWEVFSNELAYSMQGWEKYIANTCTIDECAAKIQSSIIKANEKLCPLELGNLRKRVRKAWNYRLTDPDAYKNAIKEYTKALRSKNRSSWKDFCEEVDATISQTTQNREYYSRMMTIRWVLFDFCQELLPALIKRVSGGSSMSTNLRATIEISANNSMNRGLADCIVCDH
jgi:hypothetical protein